MNASGEPRDESGEVGAAPSRDHRWTEIGRRHGELPAEEGLVRPTRSLVRVLYTSNPFYILGAGPGLRRAENLVRPWRTGRRVVAMAGSLAGYTLLLATTACVLIRLGRLWDDLRTLLLLIVMMFPGDRHELRRHAHRQPARGMQGCLVGLAFATARLTGRH